MDDKIDPKCEHIRLRLIAAAIGLQQCTKTAANVIPIQGTERVIVIGTPAEAMNLLAAQLEPDAPTTIAEDVAALFGACGFEIRSTDPAEKHPLAVCGSLDAAGLVVEKLLHDLLPEPTADMLDMLGRIDPFEMTEEQGRGMWFERLCRARAMQQPLPVPDGATVIWRADLVWAVAELLQLRAYRDHVRAKGEAHLAGQSQATKVQAVPSASVLDTLWQRVTDAREAAYTFGDTCKEAVEIALDGVLDMLVQADLAAPTAQEVTNPTDAQRYQRLRILGAAPYGTKQLAAANVLRFQSLDDFLDADIAAHPSRGEAAQEVTQQAAKAETAEHIDLPMIIRLAQDAGFNTEHCTGELLNFVTALLAAAPTTSTVSAPGSAQPDKWMPTAENVNALPEGVRRFVHDLSARCDPAGDVAALTGLRDQLDGIQIMYRKAADALETVQGCFKAAEVEGLTEVLANTTDDRLKDLVERRLMYALYAAQEVSSASAQASQAAAEADNGIRVAQDEVLDVYIHPDHPLPGTEGDRPFCRVYAYVDGGDASVGQDSTGCWALLPDQGGTELSDLLASVSIQAAASEAVRDVLAERQRQVEAEGWTPEHDNSHYNGEMALAAACYAIKSTGTSAPAKFWPWSVHWFKGSDPRRCLVKAGALILAEIERIDRAALRTNPATPASKQEGAAS